MSELSPTAPPTAWPGLTPAPLAVARLRAFAQTRAGEACLLGGLVGLALLLRVPYAQLDPWITDEWREAARGLSIAQGRGLPLTNYDAYIGALWNYLLALAYLAFGPDFRVPRWTALALGTLTIVPTYLLGRELGGRRAGLLAGLFMATCAIHILVNSHIAWSNCTTPLFTTSGFWLLVGAARRRSARWLALSGLAFGLGFQTHPSAVAVLPGALAFLLWRGRALLRPGWLAAAALLFLVGCGNYVAFAALNPDEYLGAIHLEQATNDRPCPLLPLECYTHNVLQAGFMLARLPTGTGIQLEELSELERLPLLWLYAVVLGGGAVIAARRGAPLGLCVLVPGALMLAVFQPASYRPVPEGRYAMPLLPLLFASLACVLAQPPRWLRAPLPALLTLLLLALPLWGLWSRYETTAQRRAVYGAILNEMLVIQQQVPERGKVIVDFQVRPLVDELGWHNRLPGVLVQAGFDARFDKVVHAKRKPGRGTILLLTCKGYANERRFLKLTPLSDAPADACHVVRAVMVQ